MKLNGVFIYATANGKAGPGKLIRFHPESLLYQWSKAIFLQNGGSGKLCSRTM